MSRLQCFPHSAIRILLAAVFGLAVATSAALAQPGGSSEDQTGSGPADTPAKSAPVPLDGPLLERPNLTGDWCGTRTAMRDCGIVWNISSTNFYTGVATGGLDDQFGYRGRVDAMLHIDGEKAGLWKGLSIDLRGETVFGTETNLFTGTLIPVSLALSVPNTNPFAIGLTAFKVTQALSENLLVFAGKINTCDGINQPFTGGADGVNGFLTGALVFNPVWSRTVPYSCFGAGFAFLNKDREAVFSVTVFDTNNIPTVNGFNTFFDNGMTAYVSANLPTKFFGLPGHQGISGDYSSGRYEDLKPSTPFLDPIVPPGLPEPTKKGSWALAYAFDQSLYVASDDPKRSWGLFGNLGLADENPSPVRWSANLGVGGASMVPGRKGDTFGIGYYYVGVSNSLKQLDPVLFPVGDEHGVELFYNVAVTPWCHITPDFQVVKPALEQANSLLYLGLRAKIDF
jgi:porin